MDRTEIQQTLAQLHEELNSATQVDEKTRNLLTTLAADIQRLSEQQQTPSEDEPLTEQVQEAVQEVVQQFGSEHPRLTTILNQVSAALANLGI